METGARGPEPHRICKLVLASTNEPCAANGKWVRGAQRPAQDTLPSPYLKSVSFMRLAAVEGGGTTWVAVIAEGTPDNIIAREVYDTELPSRTLTRIKEWLKRQTFDAIGIATFGPVDAVPTSPTYGFITSTPKPNWKDTDVLTGLGIKEFGKPFLFDTDVNAPAFAEFLHHKKTDTPNLSSCAYITVGTGVGVGLVVNGSTVHGLMHPEAGHIMVDMPTTFVLIMPCRP